MKRIIYTSALAVAFAVTAITGARAQVQQLKTSYFMEGSLPRYEMNAALTPQNSYFRFGFGGIGFGLNNRFTSVDKMLYPLANGKMGTFMHPSVDASDFLGSLTKQPNLGIGFNYNLFGFGRYATDSKYFWSVDFNVRAEMDAVLPGALFGVMKDLGNKAYPAGKLGVDMMLFSELALGFSMPMPWENIVVGGRVKFLMGHAQATAQFSDLTIDLSGDDAMTTSVRGDFRASVPGFSSKVDVGESGIIDDMFELKEDLMVGNVGDVLRGYGAAIDLGAELKLFDDRFKVSLGVNDLGFIAWNGRGATQAEIDELRAEYRGFDTAEDEVDFGTPDDMTGTVTGAGYNSRLSTTLNVGAEYTFLDNMLGVGVLSHTRFGRIITRSDLTITGTVRPAKWFTAAISQTVTRNRFGALGLALNFHPRGFNFFVGADYLPANWARIEGIPLPRSGKSMNFYTGISFGLGGRSKPW
ncbi:MAG: DUF5723 family protein [Alistipes sp.]|jgi:outer membrane protein W|nr:DUF5723 family protein [Alistipes sp.]